MAANRVSAISCLQKAGHQATGKINDDRCRAGLFNQYLFPRKLELAGFL